MTIPVLHQITNQTVFSKTTKDETKVIQKVEVFDSAAHPLRINRPLYSIATHDIGWVKLPTPIPSEFKPVSIYLKPENLSPNKRIIVGGYGAVQAGSEKESDWEKYQHQINFAPDTLVP